MYIFRTGTTISINGVSIGFINMGEPVPLEPIYTEFEICRRVRKGKGERKRNSRNQREFWGNRNV